MTGRLTIKIAGIKLSITYPDSLIVQVVEPIYRSFLEKENKVTEPIDIEIFIELEQSPCTEKLIHIFDCGQAWSMYRDGDGYFFRHRPPMFEKPIRQARMNRDFTEATIFFSKELVKHCNGKHLLSDPLNYPLDQILLIYILARKEGALFHAAGLNLDGKGFIFPGKSGAGKSTIARQFAASKNTKLFSDDRIVVRKIDKTFVACGTPWPGEAGIALNESMPLRGIFFINHGSVSRIKAIKPKKALERLFPVISIPWYDRDIMPKILDFCEDLVLNVPTYELYFKPSVEVVDVLEQFISR